MRAGWDVPPESGQTYDSLAGGHPWGPADPMAEGQRQTCGMALSPRVCAALHLLGGPRGFAASAAAGGTGTTALGARAVRSPVETLGLQS